MATLKISDLSVGDWVMVEWPDGERWRGRLTRLSVTGGVEVRCANGKHVRCSLDFISSIPLTAEILEKNGFECVEEDVDIELYGTPSCSIYHTKGILRYRLDTPQVSVACWNIHDLQHALRLAGVDKEINL